LGLYGLDEAHDESVWRKAEKVNPETLASKARIEMLMKRVKPK